MAASERQTSGGGGRPVGCACAGEPWARGCVCGSSWARGCGGGSDGEGSSGGLERNDDDRGCAVDCDHLYGVDCRPVAHGEEGSGDARATWTGDPQDVVGESESVNENESESEMP